MARASLAALLAVLVASPLWIFLSHMVLARVFIRTAPQLVALAAALAGALPTVLLIETLAIPGPPALLRMPLAAMYVAVVYACIAYSYFHLFNMSETARRIRILRELHGAGSLTAEEISRLYSGADVLETRFDRLLATGQLQVRAGRFVAAGRLLYMAACLVRAWRLVLGLERR
ncbi:MAG TPA: hypothetical protein VK878_02740 [Candidatus Deferrimicrobiaceae bacterium]|nr:hypothetical protein [Candidatus Deferrimicrobiaceae bacterium]